MDVAEAAALYRDTLRRLGTSSALAAIVGGTTDGAVRGWWGEDARLPSHAGQRARLTEVVAAMLGAEQAGSFKSAMAVIERARADHVREHVGAGRREAPDTQVTTRARLRLELETACVWGFARLPLRHADLPWDEFHPPQFSSLTGGRLPTYVVRDIDGELTTRLRGAFSSADWRDRLVVVVGPTKTGKTRTLLENLVRASPSRARLVWLKRPAFGVAEPPPLARLVSGLRTAQRYSGVVPAHGKLVVLVDDLQQHLASHPDSVNLPLLRELVQRGDVVAVATVHDGHLPRPIETSDGTSVLLPSTLAMNDAELAAWLQRARLDIPGLLSANEQERALSGLDLPAGSDLSALPETLASVDELAARVDAASASGATHLHRAAIVRAALDLWNIRSAAFSLDELTHFAQNHFFHTFGQRRPWTEADTDDALGWATEPVATFRRILYSEDVRASRFEIDEVIPRRYSPWSCPPWLTADSDLVRHLSALDRYNLGIRHRESGHGAAARPWLESVLSHERLGQPALINLGSIDSDDGRIDDAIANWEAAIPGPNPGHALMAMNNIAAALLKRDPGAAVPYLEACALGGDGSVASLALRQLARVAERSGDAVGVVRWNRRCALYGDPPFSLEASTSLAIRSAMEGAFDESTHWMRRVLAAPDSDRRPLALRYCSELRELEAKPSLFNELCADLAAHDDELSPADLLELAQILMRSGDRSGVVLWRRAARSGDEVTGAMAAYNRGIRQKKAGRLVSAGLWLCRAGAGFPADAANALVSLGDEWSQRGEIANALACWRRAAAFAHDDPAAHDAYVLALADTCALLSRLERSDEAVQAGLQATALVRDDSDVAGVAWFNLAGAYRGAADEDASRHALERAARSRHPKAGAVARLRLSQMTAQTGDFAEGLRLAEEASQVADDETRAEVWPWLILLRTTSDNAETSASAVLELGTALASADIAGAEGWLVRAAREPGPTGAAASFNLGALHARHERWQDATAAFERSLELQPDEPDPKAYLSLVCVALAADDVAAARLSAERLQVLSRSDAASAYLAIAAALRDSGALDAAEIDLDLADALGGQDFASERRLTRWLIDSHRSDARRWRGRLAVGALASQQQNFETAEELWSEVALSDSREAPLARFNLAMLPKLKGDEASSISALRNLIAAETEDDIRARALVALGAYYSTRGDTDRAAALYEQALELGNDPTVEEAGLALAEIHAERSDPTMISVLRRVVKIGGRYSEVALERLASGLERAGELGEAADFYSILVRSDDPDVVGRAGLRLVELSPDASISSLEMVASRGDPRSSADAALRLARSETDKAGAPRWLDIAARGAGPSAASANVLLGIELADQGDIAGAERCWTRAAEVDVGGPAAGQAQTLLGLWLLADDSSARNEEGLMRLEEAASSQDAGSRCRASLLLARHWWDQMGNARRARVVLTHAIVDAACEEQVSVEIATLLGELADAEGQDEEALRWYGEARRRNPEGASEAAFHTGVIHQRNGRAVDAVAAYQHVIADHASSWRNRARMNLATLDIGAGRSSAGIATLQEVAESGSKDATLAAYVLAEHRLKMDPERARRSLEALAEGSDEAALRAMLALSRHSMTMSKQQDAERWARRAAVYPGGETEGRRYLAAVFDELGRIDEARELWQELASDGSEVAGEAMEFLRLSYRKAGDPDRAAWWAARYDAWKSRHRTAPQSPQ